MLRAKTVWGRAQGPIGVRMVVLGVELSTQQLAAQRLNQYVTASPYQYDSPDKIELQVKFSREAVMTMKSVLRAGCKELNGIWNAKKITKTPK